MKRAKANGQFKIEHGIEMPSAHHERHSKYPFAEMQPGDSFFIPDRKATAFSSHFEWAKQHGGVFRVRTVDGGIRVWRVK